MTVLLILWITGIEKPLANMQKSWVILMNQMVLVPEHVPGTSHLSPSPGWSMLIIVLNNITTSWWCVLSNPKMAILVVCWSPAKLVYVGLTFTGTHLVPKVQTSTVNVWLKSPLSRIDIWDVVLTITLTIFPECPNHMALRDIYIHICNVGVLGRALKKKKNVVRAPCAHW